MCLRRSILAPCVKNLVCFITSRAGEMNIWTYDYRSTDIITSFSLASMTLFCRSLGYISAFSAYATTVGHPYVILHKLNVLADTYLPLLKNRCNILSNNKKIAKQGVFVRKVFKKILCRFQKNHHTTKGPGGFLFDLVLVSDLYIRNHEQVLIFFY